MKRIAIAGTVVLGGLLFLCGCDGQPRRQLAQRCVDNQGRVVDDKACEEESRRPGYGRPGYPYFYHWYWGGPTGYIGNVSSARRANTSGRTPDDIFLSNMPSWPETA